MSRFLISAAHKSSGKTTVSIGLCAAFRAKGLVVQAFKKGPDYIDPMWLSLASGRACRNLDFYLMQRSEITELYQKFSADTGVSLIEGNKGLYDGLDLDGSNSNSALARLLNVPVVLVIDARGMTRGIAPLILGYQAFDKEINIAGVILNHLGGARHESKLRAVVEHYTDVPVLGAVPHDTALEIEERHLGLMPSNESKIAEQLVSNLADTIGAQIDLDRLLEIGSEIRLPKPILPATKKVSKATTPEAIRIGIARDEAFGFYYADDIEALQSAGAELVTIDTLRDEVLPKIDGLFIGGGFPELAMVALQANSKLRNHLRDEIEGGLPVYAECGGLMYLARTLSWKGKTCEMVGVIPGDVVMHDKPVGRGYARLEESGDSPWHQEDDAKHIEIAAHEFHYSSLENLPADTRFAYKVLRGYGVDGAHDGIIYKNLLASYTHLRSLKGYNWAARFVEWVREHVKSENMGSASEKKTARPLTTIN